MLISLGSPLSITGTTFSDSSNANLTAQGQAGAVSGFLHHILTRQIKNISCVARWWHTLDPGTGEAEAGRCPNWRPVWSTQRRNPVLKGRKNKKKNKQKNRTRALEPNSAAVCLVCKTACLDARQLLNSTWHHRSGVPSCFSSSKQLPWQPSQKEQ